MTNAHSVDLLFGGDFAPIGRYQDLIAASAGEIWGDASALFLESDYSVINLESPMCSALETIDKSGPTIAADPEVAKALSVVGIDAVCLANNHILDFGRCGLEQTISTLDGKGIRHFGAGLNRRSAETPLRVTIGGRKISVFAFAEQEFNVCEDKTAGSALLDPIRIVPLVIDERKRADALIVCIHAGNEFFPYPRPQLRSLCQLLIDLGADAVVGHHPHVPGAYEVYRGKPIFYSLGNLIFDKNSQDADWNTGYFVRLKLVFSQDQLENMQFDLVPYHQSVDAGGVRVLQGEERDLALEHIEKLRESLELHPERWLQEWNDFVKRRRHQVLIDLSSPIRFPGLRRLLRYRLLRNLVLSPKQRLRRLNMLRCQSHLELTTAALETFDDKSSPHHV